MLVLTALPAQATMWALEKALQLWARDVSRILEEELLEVGL